MDLRVDRDALITASAPCIEVSDPSHALVACTCLVLESGSHGLRIRGSRVEQYAIARLDASVKADGVCAVSARAFRDAIRKMPAGEMRIEHDAATYSVKLSSGKTKMRLPSMGAEDFPATGIPADGWVEVPAGALSAALSMQYAASSDASRANLCAVRIELDGKELVGVGTDGHRMAIRRAPVESAPLVASIPTRALKVIASAAAKADTVRLAASASALAVDLGDLQIATRLTDEYPRWSGVIATIEKATNKTTVRVARAPLIEALGRVGLVVTDQSKADKLGADHAYCARIEIVDGVMRIAAEDSRAGSVSDEVPVDLEGIVPEPWGIAPSFLSQALAQQPDDVVELGIGGPFDPTVVRGSGGIAFVLPVRLKGAA